MSVTLQYPYDTPTQTVVLPSPDWGDTFNVDTKVSSFTLMDGNIKSYRRSGNIERLVWTFSNLDLDCDPAILTGLQALLVAAIGNDIKLTYTGVTPTEIWRVQCVTPVLRMPNTGKNVYSVNLAFEGVKV